MKKTALTLLLVLLFPLYAFSAEPMGVALLIVEDFTMEANTLLASRGLNPLSPIMKDKTAETLRQIGLNEVPGNQRSAKVYGIVSSYTGRVIKTVRTLDSTWSDQETGLMRLEKLRATMLKELRGSLASESANRKEPRPVPGFDLSPHDEPGSLPDNDKGGIMFR